MKKFEELRFPAKGESQEFKDKYYHTFVYDLGGPSEHRQLKVGAPVVLSKTGKERQSEFLDVDEKFVIEGFSRLDSEVMYTIKDSKGHEKTVLDTDVILDPDLAK